MLILSCDDVPATPLPAPAARPVSMSGSPASPPPPTATTLHNPRWGRTAAARLAAAQQRLARAKRGSNNRGRRRETVAARHRKVANRRRDFHHKTARELVETYDLIAVEDLAIANMLRRATPVPDPEYPGQFLPNGAAAKTGLNRSISDAGWGQFVSILRAKAEDAGRTVMRSIPGTPPTVAKPAGTQPKRTASPKRHSHAGAAGTLPRPTNMPHATSCGPGWPVTQPALREKKLAAINRQRSHGLTLIQRREPLRTLFAVVTPCSSTPMPFVLSARPAQPRPTICPPPPRP